MFLLIQNRRFRLLWIAAVFGDVSMITFITVHGWLALQITDSPFWVGATAGVTGVAMTLAAPVGGVLVDRFRKSDVVRCASVLRGTAAAVLAVLIFSDSIQLWHAMVFALAAGIADAVRAPGMKTLAMDIVGRQNLLTATAALMAAMTAIGVVGPLAIGPTVDYAGIGWAYLVIAVGDFLFICTMTFANVPPVGLRSERASPLEELRTGISYSLRHPLIRIILGAMLVTELFGWSVEPMLPVFARNVLGTGASGLGMLLAAGSAGAAVTAVILSAMGDVRQKGWLMVAGVLGFGCFLLLFATSRSLPVAMAVFVLVGVSSALYEATTGTIMQAEVDSAMRGRVLSFQAMLWGVSGVTGFHTGAIATYAGTPVAIGIGAVFVIVAGLGLTRWAGRLGRVEESHADGT